MVFRTIARPASAAFADRVATTQRWLAAAVLLACALPGIAPPANAQSENAADRYRRHEDAGRRSSDLRLRIVHADRLVIDGHDERTARLEEVTPLPVLVEAARGSTDPLVLGMLLHRCRNPLRSTHACDPVELARRWTVADTQNQVAWIELAAVLDKAGDTRGADEAWQRGTQASTFRDDSLPLTRVVLRSLPVESDLRARLDDLSYAFGVGVASFALWGSDLGRACKVAARREGCTVFADTAFRDAGDLLALRVATHLARVAGQAAEVVALRERRMQAVEWALLERSRLLDAAMEADANVGTLMAATRQVENRIERGEVRYALDVLREMGIAEEEAARRRAIGTRLSGTGEVPMQVR